MILTVSFMVVDGEGLGYCCLVFLLVFHIYLEFLAKLIPKILCFYWLCKHTSPVRSLTDGDSNIFVIPKCSLRPRKTFWVSSLVADTHPSHNVMFSQGTVLPPKSLRPYFPLYKVGIYNSFLFLVTSSTRANNCSQSGNSSNFGKKYSRISLWLRMLSFWVQIFLLLFSFVCLFVLQSQGKWLFTAILRGLPHPASPLLVPILMEYYLYVFFLVGISQNGICDSHSLNLTILTSPHPCACPPILPVPNFLQAVPCLSVLISFVYYCVCHSTHLGARRHCLGVSSLLPGFWDWIQVKCFLPTDPAL